jgi:hypothetical protein
MSSNNGAVQIVPEISPIVKKEFPTQYQTACATEASASLKCSESIRKKTRNVTAQDDLSRCDRMNKFIVI